jgi:hypothetical protein
MKKILIISLGLILVSSLSAQAGQSCDSASKFLIDTFDVNPWPIPRATQYSIKINGVFLSKEYIGEIYIATKRDSSEWHYTYQVVKQEFSKGSSGNFTVSEESPSINGNYTQQLTFHRRDFGYVACWQYEFIIR